MRITLTIALLFALLQAYVRANQLVHQAFPDVGPIRDKVAGQDVQTSFARRNLGKWFGKAGRSAKCGLTACFVHAPEYTKDAVVKSWASNMREFVSVSHTA